MSAYQSIQFAPDGDYITDYNCTTVEEVWDVVNDQGSRWIFYPIPAVITGGLGGVKRKRIVSTVEHFEWMQGLAVATVARALAVMAVEQELELKMAAAEVEGER